MNLLAAIHAVCDGVERLWVDAWAATRACRRLFKHIRTITTDLVFSDRQTLGQTLINSKPPPPGIAAQIAM